MPTYEYHCVKGHRFELVQRISAKPKARCPQCGARASRVISGGAGLIFKGSGFYITDYGKDGKGPRQDAPPAGAAPAPDAKAEKGAATTPPEKPVKSEEPKKAAKKTEKKAE